MRIRSLSVMVLLSALVVVYGGVALPSQAQATPAATSGAAAGGGQIEGCPVFPADNPWNQDISAAKVDPKSAAYIANINSNGDKFLHADFGTDPTYGFPYLVVPGTQPKIPVTFVEYSDESDPGPYLIPLTAPIEGGEDHHVLVIDRDHCILYELYHAEAGASGWQAGSGAIFDLKSNALRPDTWTSTDAAGLPVFAGLVRHDEVATGTINHALRFTVAHAQHAFIHPATHYGASDDPNAPPMGLRMRLKADYDISRTTGTAHIILTALKKYGMFVADTGTNWFISGATDPRWNDDDLDQLKSIPGDAFEVVDSGPIIKP